MKMFDELIWFVCLFVPLNIIGLWFYKNLNCTEEFYVALFFMSLPFGIIYYLYEWIDYALWERKPMQP